MRVPVQFFLVILLALGLGAWAGPSCAGAKVLFDADSFDLLQPHYPCGPSDFANESHAQRFPTPSAAGVTAATAETYWTGGISAFAVDLVKLGHKVEGSLPVDGVTIAMASGTSIQRNHPGDPPGDPSSWTVTGAAAGSPGSGAGAPSAAGVVINEAGDAADFQNEFIELFYDAQPQGPDTTAPAPVQDLAAEPRSDTVVRLSWTAPGDDGVDGTATSYDMRSAPHPITSEAGFAAATPLVGEPSPATAGTTEVWEVPGLTPATSYYFALRTSDEVGNFSALSNSLGGTTGLPGSGSGAPTADHLVISEIQTRGSLSHDDEFIELYNPTAVPADLTGWSLQYKSAGGTTFLVAPLPGAVIPAGGYFLTARPPGFYSGSVTPDAVNSSFAMSASGGHVFLVTSDSGLASCTGDCPEGSSAPVHAAGESLERAPGAADYKIRRATSPDFMQIQPIPDDTHLLDRTTGTTYLDTGSPAAGIVFFYFVNATDGGAGESDD